MNKQMMKCGHASNGKNANGNPVCVICVCEEIAHAPIKLDGRFSRCLYGCGSVVGSKESLMFFEYSPMDVYDRHFCGCIGYE